MLTVISFGRGAPSTIVGGVIELVHAGMLLRRCLFFASILVPVLKLLALALLLVSIHELDHAPPGPDPALPHHRGDRRWSMVDVFMTGILAALVALGNFATITAGAGAIAFCAVVIVTIFASMACPIPGRCGRTR